MSVLGDLITEIVMPSHLEIRGDSAVYVAVASRPRPVTVAVIRLPSAFQERAAHGTQEEVIEVTSNGDPVTGISSPQLGDSLVWGGFTWNYLRTMGNYGVSRTMHFSRTIVLQSGHNRPPSL